MPTMQKKATRLVITGHDDAGAACVAFDGGSHKILHRESRPHVALSDLWEIARVPTDLDADGRNDEPFALSPKEGGIKFRVVQFDPEHHDNPSRGGADAFAEMGAGDNHIADARHPYMHRTETVDFAIVLEGSITMMLDHEDVALSAGDVVIQRGTNHAWSNRGSTPCRIAFVLVSATGTTAAPVDDGVHATAARLEVDR
jgi:mannose-6-phosphate isomerase-like protein (cupin superfamily)